MGVSQQHQPGMLLGDNRLKKGGWLAVGCIFGAGGWDILGQRLRAHDFWRNARDL
jgi:hypothetical protein